MEDSDTPMKSETQPSIPGEVNFFASASTVVIRAHGSRTRFT